MADSSPKCIRIVPVARARICSGQDGRRQGESDSQQLSIPGRKDKKLLSQCQHSMAQRDFIDQRTAMLNHYYILVILFIMLHGSSLLPHVLFKQAFKAPCHAKTDKKKLPKKPSSFSCK